MVTENGILSILKDDYPIDPSGTTAADRLAREIGITGSDREAYQDAMTKLFPSLRNADWSLFVKFLSFAESARFDRSFYAAFASFIKNDFPEQGGPGFVVTIPKTANRCRCIGCIAEKFPDLFEYQWIKDTSMIARDQYPQSFLACMVVYAPDEALDFVADILMPQKPAQRRTIVSNLLFSFSKKFQSEKIRPYLALWGEMLSREDLKDYQTLCDHFFA